MQLTESYKRVVPSDLLTKYSHLEVRNGAAVLQAGHPDLLDEVVEVLRSFHVYDDDILIPGGNRGTIPIRLDSAFAALGWLAVRINTEVTLVGKVKLSASARTYGDEFMRSSVANEGFEVDNMKDRVALDVEWNAKDGNLDRDLSAYRSLYDFGLIDVAVIVTRDHHSIHHLALNELGSEDAARRLGTHTTTNMHKLRDRLTRGDSGGCPVWAVGITRMTWAGSGVPIPPVTPPPASTASLSQLAASLGDDVVAAD